MSNQIYYGNNLDVLQKYIKDESVDLCYIDPPYNSQKDYNQIYNNIDGEDKAQVLAFTDTWKWNEIVERYFDEITDLTFSKGKYPLKTQYLLLGLSNVLGKGGLLAYLVHITQRIVEIHRVLKPTGSFYLHCDKTACHYIKLILDSVFVSQGGDFKNEIIWHYTGNSVPEKCFPRKHDTIFLYTKQNISTIHFEDILVPYSPETEKRYNHTDSDGRRYKISALRNGKQDIIYRKEGKYPDDTWDIPIARGKESLGYPTQKPEKLMERIIKASSNEGDTVLDAYCGCGTTIAVAHRLSRNWIGIDITYQSISLILKRLTDAYGKKVMDSITLNGIPRDLESATALALKKDDPTRKEFEKWAVLTYSNNKARPNEKKGSDGGIDGIGFIYDNLHTNQYKKMLISVKSGKPTVSHIRDLLGTVEREKDAVVGVYITLQKPTQPMIEEAAKAGRWRSELFNMEIPRIEIVTVEEILQGKKIHYLVNKEVVKKASRQAEKDTQTSIDI